MLQKKMNMVETNSLDGFVDVAPVPGDKGFPEDGPLDLLDFFDFPMESLEDGDIGGGDWDASKSHCLGPIPSDVMLGLPPFPSDDNTGNALPRTRMPPQLNAHIHSPVSVLDSSGSCSGGKGLPIKSDVVIPVRTRSKRARPSNLNPWFVIPPISSARKMIRSRKTKEKRKRVSTISSVQNADYSFQYTEEEDLFNASDATLETKEGSQQRSGPVKKCTHCEVTKTPQWREGPMGPKTLCNACGVRYRSGRLFPEYRPAASPTFVPTIHSNSHKKVIEMRGEKAMPETAVLHDDPVSPPPEFFPVNGSLFDFIY